jgi:hypothetical protein
MTTITPTPPAPTTAADVGVDRDERIWVLPGNIVTVHTTITRDRYGQDVEILEIAAGIELTSGPRGLAWLLPGTLHDSEREQLSLELLGYVTAEQPEPVVLERLIDRGDGTHAHIAARVLPLTHAEHRELDDLLGEEDHDLALQLAAAYADDLATERTAGHPLGRIPMRDLADYAPTATL